MRVIVHVGAPSSFEVVRLIVAVARGSARTEIAVLTPYYLAADRRVAVRLLPCGRRGARTGLDVYVYVYPQAQRQLRERAAHGPSRARCRTSWVPRSASESLDAARGVSRRGSRRVRHLHRGATASSPHAGTSARRASCRASPPCSRSRSAPSRAAADSGDSPRSLAARSAAVDDVVSVIAGDMAPHEGGLPHAWRRRRCRPYGSSSAPDVDASPRSTASAVAYRA